jgi:hypothetical protein
LDESIMHKPATTLHGPAPDAAKGEPRFRGIVSKLRNVVRIEIPAGYEDETGFHTGVNQGEEEIKQPQVW